MADPIVVDLSHHNPTPDWAKLKAGGTLGVIHKATEGTSFKDKELFPRARDAMEAGLKWSTYHFLRPGSMQDQMDFYLETIDPVEGERVCLDHEDAGVSLASLQKAVEAVLKSRPDLQIAIYSGHLIKEQLGNNRNATLAEKTALWIAQYTSNPAPSWPTGTWPQWSLWQYTDKAKVSGISQPVDGNRWNGDEAALLAWFGPAGAEPAPPPEPPPVDLPLVKIEVPPNVRVSINGQIVAG